MVEEYELELEYLLFEDSEVGLGLGFDMFGPTPPQPPPPATMGVGGVLDDDDIVIDDSWMADLEHLLMNDDYDYHQHQSATGGGGGGGSGGEIMMEDDHDHNDVFLLDSPHQEWGSTSASTSSQDKHNSPESDANCISNSNSNTNMEVAHANPKPQPQPQQHQHTPEVEVEVEDPSSAIHKRKLRNRDAAMRSRERKKMHVKELEMKSRYLEGEIRRMERLLQCCYAENQMLRISLQSGTAFGSSMAKPESAALLLESLLLGSLVWCMVLLLMWVSPLSKLLHLMSSQDAVAPGSLDIKRDRGNAAPPSRGKQVNKAIEILEWLPFSYLITKRCRGARTKIKSVYALLC